jgi:hypothetical protein
MAASGDDASGVARKSRKNPMRSAHFVPLIAFIYASFSAVSAMAQAVAPSVQIVNSIDERRLVAMKGNTHPFANAKNDRGRVSPDLPMTDLILVLSRSPQQQAVFEKFVASQYDPHSPNFRQWLKPDEVGIDFGPSPVDIATISDWLTGHGFSINEVARDRMSIRFSGTAAQAEGTFHTEIHNLEVKGVRHIGNMTDPQIPAALAPAVVGVKSLHNFFARPLHRTGSQVTRDAATGKWLRPADPTADTTQNPSAGRVTPRPQFGSSGGNNTFLEEDVAPYRADHRHRRNQRHRSFRYHHFPEHVWPSRLHGRQPAHGRLRQHSTSYCLYKHRYHPVVQHR